MAAIALIDGEHHPAAVRDALDGLDLAGVVICGGEEKLAPGPLEEHYGRPVETDPDEALRRLAPSADAVVDLADEPVLPPSAKLRMAALALHLGLRYEAPGLRLDPPRYEPVPFGGPTLAVIATGKRTGKTAVACHLARLVRDRDPVVVCMGGEGRRSRWWPSRTSRSTISSRSSSAAVTRPPTTSRTPSWPGCARSGAGAWAAGWRAPRPSRR